MKKLNKDNQGFTIIEVLIVLVIAAVIMLIVFLAVPALQRNSRNNSYRNEASQILSATAEFITNHNGETPSDAADATEIMDLTNNQNITDLDLVSGSGTSTPTFSTAILHTSATCGSAGSGSSHDTGSGSSRALALVYAVENSSGDVVAQCLES